MGMMLGNRQLAMLREMGVRVWQPAAAKAIAAPADDVPVQIERPIIKLLSATDSIAAGARNHSATASNSTQTPAAKIEPVAVSPSATGEWRMGSAHLLYALPESQPAANWLVLLEASSEALQGGFDPLVGDAGKLLDNMLRAARLHTSARVTLVPMLRASSDAAPGVRTDLHASLLEMIASLQPAVILLMGRLGAQAVLQSTDPLGKLRGRVHQLHGTPAIVTLEPVYLLRNPLDKAKAWEDLCLALSVVGPND